MSPWTSNGTAAGASSRPSFVHEPEAKQRLTPIDDLAEAHGAGAHRVADGASKAADRLEIVWRASVRAGAPLPRERDRCSDGVAQPLLLIVGEPTSIPFGRCSWMKQESMSQFMGDGESTSPLGQILA